MRGLLYCKTGIKPYLIDFTPVRCEILLDLYTGLCYTESITKKVGDYMPEICRFKGIIIKMIFKDNDKHHKPHVHVYYGEYPLK